MPRTIADLMAETLNVAGVKRIYGVVWQFAERLHQFAAPAEEDRLDPHAARGGGRLRRRGRRASDRRARRLRRKLRAGQSASDQRPVRLPSQPRAGAGDRGPYPECSEIGGAYFQATHPENLFKDCSHYVELISKATQAPRVFERAIRTAIAGEAWAWWSSRATWRCETIDAPPAMMVPPAPVVRRRRWTSSAGGAAEPRLAGDTAVRRGVRGGA